jgi:UDP-N-acetylmuramoyl-tripeptide--D-alanyl-D-alanine ligase
MLKLSAGEVRSGTGGDLILGAVDTVFSGVSIDTRTLQEGNLFFAIRGPHQDGHRFIPDALSRGALGIVAAQDYEYPGRFPDSRAFIKVEDTHQALKHLATAVRRGWPGILVAITGSMGKTTTREFIAQILQSEFRVYRTPRNYNNLFGLPLALLGLQLDSDIGIFEMGMSAPGEIAEMCRIAAPDMGVLTNVAPVHLEFFDSLENIAQAKAELVDALPAKGTLIYNTDDPLVREIAGRHPGPFISFGLSDSADVRADAIEIVALNKTRFMLSCDGMARPAAVPFAGTHYVMNALAAVAAGRQYNIALAQIIETLAKLQQVSMRGPALSFKDGFTAIDDSYNSNPRALMQMIDVLAGVPSFSRRILVAGEMLELGSQSDALHFECGVLAARRQLDLVLGIQGAAREIVRAFRESGGPDREAHFFPDSDRAADFVCDTVRAGDLLLIKGSRGVHTERIVERVRSRFELSSL